MADYDDQAALRLFIIEQFGSAPDTLTPGKFTRWGRRSNPQFYVKPFDCYRGAALGDFSTEIHITWSPSVEGRSAAERAAMKAAATAVRVEQQQRQREAWRRAKDRIGYWLRRSKPASEGVPLVRYLRDTRFRLSTFELPACLRYVPDLPYVHDGETIGSFPAMLAPLVDRQGEVLSLHRTWLTHEGRKAVLPGPSRKLMPACGLLRGCCIPLYEPQADALGIGEGVETAIAAHLASGVPTVAAYSAGNLMAWKWPAVRRVVIFGDADDAGRNAAAALRARVIAAGLQCEVMTPSIEGQDWADVFASRDAEVTR